MGMRDFGWYDELWCVIKDDGSFAGVPCLSYEEARDLSAHHEGSEIFRLTHEDNAEGSELWDDDVDETGYDPYMGCYTGDC